MTPLLIAAALIVASPASPGVEDRSPAIGHWVGVLDLGPVELTLVLHVEAGDGGGLTARLDSPDQGSDGLEVASIVLEGRTLDFESPRIAARFRGELAEDGKAIVGTFTQGGRPTPLTLSRTAEDDLPRPVGAPEGLQGIWQGPIESPLGQRLRVALRVKPDSRRPGSWTAAFDSIDQGASGIPVTAIALEGDAVRFEVGSIGGSFEGTIDEARTRIAGAWSQSILSLPLTLEKTEAVATPDRPQHPEPPFPYRDEEVAFENVAAGITLAGTLTTPEGGGPFPAAVLVSGSGPQDRDETLMGHKPFLVLADHLTRAGIAVLRFDDRGVGASGGDHGSATSEDFAADALAAVRFLRDHDAIGRDAVGIVGHSEGGMVGPMAAVDAPGEVAFLVLLAGTGVPGKEIIPRQAALIARASGSRAEAVEAQVATIEALIARVGSDEFEEAGEAEIEGLAREALAAQGPEGREALDEAGAAVSLAVSEMESPWFRFFLSFDPRPTLRQVDCPVLALFGEKDLQVDPEQNAPEVEAALRAGGNDRAEVEVLPGLNHLFQPAETGSPLEYGAIEQTIAPEVLERVAGWILGVAGRD